MTKQNLFVEYAAAEKPYEVCAHTKMGGYMEFLVIEKNIMFEENARIVADSYASTWRNTGSENVKSIAVRKQGAVVYEVEI